jgi:O-antigen ligase
MPETVEHTKEPASIDWYSNYRPVRIRPAWKRKLRKHWSRIAWGYAIGILLAFGGGQAMATSVGFAPPMIAGAVSCLGACIIMGIPSWLVTK